MLTLVSSTRWNAAVNSVEIEGRTSERGRPRWASIGRPLIAASAGLSRRKRSSWSKKPKPTGALSSKLFKRVALGPQLGDQPRPLLYGFLEQGDVTDDSGEDPPVRPAKSR